ncbi:hypothetical protein Tco_1467093 [Tanacetum coccineum]
MNKEKGIVPTKIELTLEQSQQGASDDVLAEIVMLEYSKAKLEDRIKAKLNEKWDRHPSIQQVQDLIILRLALADTFILLGMKFDSSEAQQLNKARGISQLIHQIFCCLMRSDVNNVCFADEASHLIYDVIDDNLSKVLDIRCLDQKESLLNPDGASRRDCIS